MSDDDIFAPIRVRKVTLTPQNASSPAEKGRKRLISTKEGGKTPAKRTKLSTAHRNSFTKLNHSGKKEAETNKNGSNHSQSFFVRQTGGVTLGFTNVSSPNEGSPWAGSEAQDGTNNGAGEYPMPVGTSFVLSNDRASKIGSGGTITPKKEQCAGDSSKDERKSQGVMSAGNQGETQPYCPFCMVPFGAVAKSAQERETHLATCLDSIPSTKDCPDGPHCTSMDPPHYRNFNHATLALVRSAPPPSNHNDGFQISKPSVKTETANEHENLLDFDTDSESSRNFEISNTGAKSAAGCGVKNDNGGYNIDEKYRSTNSNFDHSVDPRVTDEILDDCSDEDDIVDTSDNPEMWDENAVMLDQSGPYAHEANGENGTKTGMTAKMNASDNLDGNFGNFHDDVVWGDDHDWVADEPQTEQVPTKQDPEPDPQPPQGLVAKVTSFFIPKSTSGSTQTAETGAKNTGIFAQMMAAAQAKAFGKPGKQQKSGKTKSEPQEVGDPESTTNNSESGTVPWRQMGRWQGGGGQKNYAQGTDKPPPCPFYKRVEGTRLTVDAFKYGSIPNCEAYFLSHFHSDHYGGLDSHWTYGPIYCTVSTARLAQLKLRVKPEYLHPLPLNTPTIVDGVTVTCLDANHCPGSVMFLFALPNGRKILHTGDFRASRDVCTDPLLQNIRLSVLYLDTTYCNPTYAFPPQDATISHCVYLVRKILVSNPRTLVVVGSYTIGKERVFKAVAEAMQCQVYVEPSKHKVLSCLDDPQLRLLLTCHAHTTRLHVVSMFGFNKGKLQDYLQTHGGPCGATHLLAIKPTGWTHSSSGGLDSIKPVVSGKISIIGLPYSEHSSFDELRQFVQTVRPQKIIPTVNVGNPTARNQMQKLFREWMEA